MEYIEMFTAECLVRGHRLDAVNGSRLKGMK
jgi:hypothetical protein